MDQKYLSEIKAREQAATPGPWPRDGSIFAANGINNCDFIAAARTDIPALIAEMERLTKENQGLRANSMIQEHIISGGRDPIKDGEIMRLIMDNAAKDQQIADLKESKEVIENDLINANMNLEHAEADNATLKKALELSVHDMSTTLDELSKSRKIKITKDATDEEQCQYYVQQAQEQEEKK